MTEWLGPACALCLCLAALRVEQALNRPGECRAVADPVRGTVRVYCRRPPDGREIRRVLTEQGCSVHALTGV